MSDNIGWSYDWLPVEIHEFLIAHLPDFQSFRNCRLVNCLWYNLTHELSGEYWKVKYEYYFGGPKQNQSYEDAFSSAQKQIVKQHKHLTSGIHASRSIVEQSLSAWARKLGHKGFLQNVVMNEERLNELLSLPDYGQQKHSQWFYQTQSNLTINQSVTREKQRAELLQFRQELAERKKLIAQQNYK